MFSTAGRLKSASVLCKFFNSLPHDASAEHSYEIACGPSVRLSVRNDQLKAHALVDDYVSVQHSRYSTAFNQYCVALQFTNY